MGKTGPKEPQKVTKKGEEILVSKLKATELAPTSNSILTQGAERNKMADSAVSKNSGSIIAPTTTTVAAGPQPEATSDSLRQMATAIQSMSQQMSLFMSAQAGQEDDTMTDQYDYGEDYDCYYDEDEYDENELLGFANDGTPVVRKKRPAEAATPVVPDLDSKKLKLLEQMKTESSTEEPKGPKIQELLAQNVTNFMRNRPDEAKLNKAMDDYLPPENCPGLETIRVNPNIWRNISHEARTQDLKQQRLHRSFIKGVSAMVQMIDILVTDWDAHTGILNEDAFQRIMSHATNSLKFLGNSNFGLCMRRREFLRSAIKPEYMHLCSTSAPFTTQLFGDEVLKTIKELSEENRVTNPVFQRPANPFRGRGRGRGRASYPARSGKGGPFKNRGRARGRGRGRGQRQPLLESQEGDSQDPSHATY